MLTVSYAGSRYESQKEAPDGISETVELWLRAAHLDGHYEYRAIDRAKGTGTMSRVHAISIRDGKFVNARIRPDGRGNASSWIVSIPVPSGIPSDHFMQTLQYAEQVVNGDRDQILESKLAMLHTYLEGKPIDFSTLDPRMAIRSKFETVDYMEHDLETLAARKLFVRKAGPRLFEWRKRFQVVPVPPLQTDWTPPPAEVFVLSLNADERALIRELLSLHARMEDAEGNVHLRLPNELPLFEEEIVQFMDKAERFGLVKSIGDNPHGILGKVWTLDFPLLLVCILQIGLSYPEEKRQQAHAEAASPPEVASDVEHGLVAAAADPGASKADRDASEAPRAEAGGEGLELVLGRTISIRAHSDSEEELFRLQDERKQVRQLLDEAEAKRLDSTGELDRLKERLEGLRQELSEKERVAAEANELSVRLQTQLASLDEKIKASAVRSADEVVDRAFDLVRQEFDNSGLPQDALIEAIKRRVPPDFSF